MQTSHLRVFAVEIDEVQGQPAAAIVAYQAKNAAGVRLIDEPVINTAAVLLVATSILGPMLTERFGRERAGRSPASVDNKKIRTLTID